MVRHLTDEDRETIRQKYEAGEPVADIARAVGFSLFSTHKHLRLMGLRRYGDRRQHKVREDLFTRGDAEERYWLGVLITDGSVCKNRVKLSLEEPDRDLVDKFAAFVANGGGPTSYDNVVEFRFTSAPAVVQLAKAGVIPRKSKIAEAAAWLCDDADFWRGVIDGDGGVHIYSRGLVTVTGHSESKLLQQWAAYVGRITGTPPNVVPRPDQPSVSDVRCSGKRAVAVVNALYDRPGPALNSTKAVAQVLMRGVSEKAKP
jgi:hypothetical protein